MSKPILYHGEPNGPSLSVLAALEESGLEIECRYIELALGARHRELHKAGSEIVETVFADFAVEGEGPVLVAEGEAMSEAVFLAQYFDEAAGGCGLQPQDPYAHWQMLMWCRQATERLSPAVAYLGNLAFTRPDVRQWNGMDFDGAVMLIESEDLRARWRELRDSEAEPVKIADSKAKIDQFAERIERQLADGRDWLMGDFSIADLETFAWMRPAQLLKADAFAGKPALATWMECVEARPSVQAALARAQTDDP
ncbi:MAG TPA: glutathione S-transferase family protein, partial [Sphingomonadaceae bacterium]|nr:glutathione S-transferase family protein [Sphingomonadaceae bacterium]